MSTQPNLTAQVQTFLEGSDSQLIGILNTMLPFVGVETEQFSEVCGGSLYSKWWVSAERSEELAAVNPG
jgi:hypothetical protein